MKLVTSGKSAGQVATELDLTETSLREWVKQAAADAGTASPEGLATEERQELARLRRENKQLRMEREFRSCGHLFRQGERVKFAFILAKQVAFPIATMCRLLGVSTSGFYDWRKQPVCARETRDAALLKKVTATFKEFDGKYGSPRVCRELRAEGHIVSERKVAALMREEALVARPKKRYRATTDSKHDDPIAPNLLERNFRTEHMNHVWVTDVTAIWTHSGWLFLAAMLDLFSRRVVGWATSATNDRFLALDALRDAIQKRHPLPGLKQHTDRGSPYCSADYRDELERFGIEASMSRKGDCWDNAVAESFFSTLKTELVRDRIYASHDAATGAIGEYIDGFYNSRRRHSYLGYISPIEFELKHRATALAA